MSKIIMSNACIFAYEICEDAEISICIEKWKSRLKNNLEDYSENKSLYPKDKDYWSNRIKNISQTLEQGFSVLSREEYNTKIREYFLSKPVLEISSDEFYRSLNILPPINWVCCDEFEMFHISEGEWGSFHAQYYRNKKTNKCFTCVSDVYDKSTWIDKRV